jgi:hypothetical protein
MLGFPPKVSAGKSGCARSAYSIVTSSRYSQKIEGRFNVVTNTRCWQSRQVRM